MQATSHHEPQLNQDSNELYHWLTPLALLVVLISGALLLFQGIFRFDQVMDWLGREGGALASWWAITTVAGLSAFPILFRLMPGLSSRGYALARAAGIMLIAFIFWFFASLGLLANQPGSILLAWLVVLIIAWMVWTRRSDPEGVTLRDWFREHWTLMLVVEILFVALFIGWSVYRAHEPEIRTTEKPMEMMFVNAIRQSETFPPEDAWLADYSISYYYFGYVIMAGLADVSGVNSGIAFGMMGPLLFALSGIGVLGVVYDLVRARDWRGRWRRIDRHSAIGAGLLGTVFLIIMGNLGTTLIGLPWHGYTPAIFNVVDPVDYFEFWGMPDYSRLAQQVNEPGQPQQWLMLDDNRLLAPGEPLPHAAVPIRDIDADGVPDWAQQVDEEHPFYGQFRNEYTEWGYWWWFDYTRVVDDRFLSGGTIGINPITEFPHFSFVLGDMHPHVLALPFAILAIGLAAGVVLSRERVEWWGIVLLAIWVGGMIFMNSWDAVYIPFLIGAEALRRIIRNGGRLYQSDWLGILGFGAAIVFLTWLFYLPWILSFTSQAGGIFFNVLWNTRPAQMFILYGGFFLLLLPFLVLDFWRGIRAINWRGVLITFVIAFILIIVLLPFGGALFYDTACGDGDLRPQEIRNANGELVELREPSALKVHACNARHNVFGSTDRLDPDSDDPKPWQGAFWTYTVNRLTGEQAQELQTNFWSELLLRRMESYLTEGLLLLTAIIIVFRLFGKPSSDEAAITYHPATGFGLLAVGAGVMLLFIPDFIYLVDNFSVRINTVFKLYYQAWIFFSVAAAYGVFYVLNGGRELLRQRHNTILPQATDDPEAATIARSQQPSYPGGRLLVQFAALGLVLIVLAASLTYPYYAFRSRGLMESGILGERSRYATCIADVEERIAENPGITLDPERECEDRLRDLTLDGRPTAISPSEWEVVQCLMAFEPNDETIVAEAPYNGGYWTQGNYSRVSMLTGVPTLLGWINHERQWRGDTFESVTETVMNEAGGIVDSREMRVDRLYRTTDVTVAQSIIDLYGIDYIMVGDTERTRYNEAPEGLEKFEWWLTPACVSEDGRIVLYTTN